MGRFTYRCDEEKAIRIKALKAKTGFSVQRLLDMFIETWLWKLQHEGTIFSDLTPMKQIDYVCRDMSKMPFFSRWFIHSS